MLDRCLNFKRDKVGMEGAYAVAKMVVFDAGALIERLCDDIVGFYVPEPLFGGDSYHDVGA
jgi:hypothetical protein